MTTHKIHYAGGLVIEGKKSRKTMLRGWTCCRTGDYAVQVRQEGNYTFEPGAVTCGACIRKMQKAGILLVEIKPPTNEERKP